MTAGGTAVPVPGPAGNPDDEEGRGSGGAPAGLPRRVAVRCDTFVRGLHRRIRKPGRIVLLIYGLLLGYVGLMDVYGGLDLGAKMVGVLLTVAAGIIVGSCATALASAASPTRSRLLPGDLAAILVNSWIMSRVFSDFAAQPVLVMTAVLVISATLLALCLAWGDVHDRPAGPQPSHPSLPATSSDKQARSTVLGAVIAAGGALLAASFTVPQFYYSALYEPSQEQPVVQAEAGIESIERREHGVELTVEITLENKGKTPVTMLTSLYEITGTKLKSPPGPEESEYGEIVGDNWGSAARMSPDFGYEDPEPIQVGPVGEDFAWIGPDEKLHATLVARVPEEKDYPLYRVSVDVAVARADRVEVESRTGASRQTMTCEGTDIAQDRRPLTHRGTFDRLTESKRELVTYWVLSGKKGWESPWWPPFPWNGVSIEHAGHGCDHALNPDDDGLENEAMVGWTSTVAEAWRPPDEP
ncbi:hypothetical protein [Streptomyces paradoxus]|uniref:hypothetical protein n=1 Tax=Streptomyces paradoxus TaxID=66375 RepID=UPI003830A103